MVFLNAFAFKNIAMSWLASPLSRHLFISLFNDWIHVCIYLHSFEFHTINLICYYLSLVISCFTFSWFLGFFEGNYIPQNGCFTWCNLFWQLFQYHAHLSCNTTRHHIPTVDTQSPFYLALPMWNSEDDHQNFP